MNKQEYLAQLRAALACLPEGEIEESVAFYTEMIERPLLSPSQRAPWPSRSTGATLA